MKIPDIDLARGSFRTSDSHRSVENSIDIEKCLARIQELKDFTQFALENSIDIEKCLAQFYKPSAITQNEPVENSIDIEKCLAHTTLIPNTPPVVVENSIDIEKCLAQVDALFRPMKGVS